MIPRCEPLSDPEITGTELCEISADKISALSPITLAVTFLPSSYRAWVITAFISALPELGLDLLLHCGCLLCSQVERTAPDRGIINDPREKGCHLL